MKDKLPSGEAYRQAFKNQAVKKATKKRRVAQQNEWIGDSEMTREQLIAKQVELREAMYLRHPELRV
jgi:hypothetical protein